MKPSTLKCDHLVFTALDSKSFLKFNKKGEDVLKHLPLFSLF